MNKLIKLVAVTVIIFVAVIWGQTYLPALLPPTPLTSPTVETPAPSHRFPYLPVNRGQLWQHLEQVTGERYRELDRSHTRDYLVQYLENLGFSPTRHPYENGGVNIVGEHPGTDPNAGKILVAAHYDTVPNSPGADDNASGIAGVLEIARIFSQIETLRTLQIAFFDQEELGLLGSLAFTGDRDQLKDLQAVIILDMVGYACRESGCQKYPEGLAVEPWLKGAGVKAPDQGEFIAVVGDAEHLPLLKIFSQVNHQWGETLPPMVTIPIPFKGLLTPDVLRSDHAPFGYQNIGAVLVSDTANFRSPHYHQPTDTLETLDQDFLAGVIEQLVNVVNVLLQTRDSYNIKEQRTENGEQKLWPS